MPRIGAESLVARAPLKKLYNEACAQLRPPLDLKLADFRNLVATIADCFLAHRAAAAKVQARPATKAKGFKRERFLLRHQVFRLPSGGWRKATTTLGDVQTLLSEAGLVVPSDRVRTLLELFLGEIAPRQNVPYVAVERMLLCALSAGTLQRLVDFREGVSVDSTRGADAAEQMQGLALATEAADQQEESEADDDDDGEGFEREAWSMDGDVLQGKWLGGLIRL